MEITLSQLRALIAVIDRGSFTDAASQLGVSQSAVSHSVASLEQAVGGPVLKRGGSVALTRLGDRIVAHARSALASVSALESAVRLDETLTGTVRLGAVATVCQGLLPELLPLWAARLPKVEVQIYEGDDEELPGWLEAGVIDAAILVGPSPMPEGGKLIATDEFSAVIRADHPLALLEAISLSELLVDGLIVSAGGCESQVKRMYAKEQLTCTFEHRVREISTLFRMVEQGFGVAIVPSLGQGMLPEGVFMRPLAPRQHRELVLSGPASRPWHPLAQALVEAS